MQFKSLLVKGKLLRRYKRFLADIQLEDGSVVVAHTTNSGSMKSCIEEGAPVYLSPASDPKRKTQFTWEMIFLNGNWVGVNTMWPNLLVYDAVKNQEIPSLKGYHKVEREVKFGDSRFDVFCENDKEKCFIEVKNASMKEGNKVLFPDAVTLRGQKHLRTLMEVKQKGMRAVMFYVVQRMDVDVFAPAKHIDPVYASTLLEAINNGVEVVVYQAKVEPSGIKLHRKLPLELP